MTNMTNITQSEIASLLRSAGCSVSLAEKAGISSVSPLTGSPLATLAADTKVTLEQKIGRAREAQARWGTLDRAARAAQLEKLSAAIKTHRETLAKLIHFDAGKTLKESEGETDGSAEIILKTIKDASLPEFGGMLRVKERPPVGVVGLITSFNFPLVVANWTIAPALLAGNSVIWKPSEKTLLPALAYKAIFDQAMDGDLLQLALGGREVGEMLVAHEAIDMISATGSVAMGQGIKKILAKKKNNHAWPILELGGNNGVIISGKLSKEHLAWSLAALMNSFLGTGGQRCTNTRRLIVQRDIYNEVVGGLTKHIADFLAAGKAMWDQYAYAPLIDKDAFERFERAKKQAIAEGGSITFGKKMPDAPNAYFVEPALALMPSQTDIMLHETFAPLLFVVPYDDIEHAILLVNAPENAGLVNGIYTQSQAEADLFAAENDAGHTLINSPKGTGTPAYGMGFGGNKASGEGEILNAADPLRPFTREGFFSRIAQNKDIPMSS